MKYDHINENLFFQKINEQKFYWPNNNMQDQSLLLQQPLSILIINPHVMFFSKQYIEISKI